MGDKESAATALTQRHDDDMMTAADGGAVLAIVAHQHEVGRPFPSPDSDDCLIVLSKGPPLRPIAQVDCSGGRLEHH